MTTSSPKTNSLSTHEDVLADFLESFEEPAEDFDEVTVLHQAQVDLALGPQSEQTASRMRPNQCLIHAHAELHFVHDGFSFCRLCTPANKEPAEGGGPVKRFLRTGQKCLFPTSWSKRYPRTRESS